jgi:hypothetical protein
VAHVVDGTNTSFSSGFLAKKTKCKPAHWLMPLEFTVVANAVWWPEHWKDSGFSGVFVEEECKNCHSDFNGHFTTGLMYP